MLNLSQQSRRPHRRPRTTMGKSETLPSCYAPEQNLAVTHFSRDGSTQKAASDGTVTLSRSVAICTKNRQILLAEWQSQTPNQARLGVLVSSVFRAKCQVARHDSKIQYLAMQTNEMFLF